MALLGVLPGIVVAVALSILNVFRRTWWPYQAVLGTRPGLPGFHDVAGHPDATTTARARAVQIRRATGLRERPYVPRAGPPLAEEPGVRWIVIAAEPITDVDTTAADMLEELDERLNERGISLVFAEMKDPVHRKITRYELTRTIDPEHFYPTIKAAVTAFNSLDAGGQPNDREGGTS